VVQNNVHIQCASNISHVKKGSVCRRKQPGGFDSRYKKKREKRQIKSNLQNLAAALLDLLPAASTVALAVGPPAIPAFLNPNDCVDSELKHLVYTAHFLAAAFDICCTHSLGDGLPLFRRDRSEALRLEEFNAGALAAKVGFEANQDYRSCRTEMQDFGVPLYIPLVTCLSPTFNNQQSTYLVHYIFQRNRTVNSKADK
jgi:hypothetical protein